jgi:hypothetical protein
VSRVKLALAVIIATLGTALGTIATAAPTETQRACMTPRVFALTVTAARARITAAGCRLAGVSYERPRTLPSRVTDQVPPPGAVLPPRGRVFLIVS